MAAPMENRVGEEADNFKVKFKYYKRRQPAPDLSDVVDFDAVEQNAANSLCKVKKINAKNVGETRDGQTDHADIVGLQPVSQWKIYEHEDLPGLIFISNPFLPGFQRYWVSQCLSEYPTKPNVTNLDAHMTLSDTTNIWEKSIADRDKTESTFHGTLVHKLRWVTLGYHHDWDSKKYSSHNCTKFPMDLSVLTRFIASALGYEDYKAEAAIINFYHLDSTLGGHTDHSEPNNEAPLFSISFGQTAIFLLGGRTKAVDPVAMYIKSGDIVVMAGAARLSYHAVPKILASSKNICDMNNISVDWSEAGKCKCTCDSCAEVHQVNNDILKTVRGSQCHNLELYLRTSRINMNVRQVLKPGQTSLEEETTDTGDHSPPVKIAKVGD